MLNASSDRCGRGSCHPVTEAVVTSGPAIRWECAKCRKLLGTIENGRVHLSFARGPEYLVSAPVTSACRYCGTLNEYSLVPGSAKPLTHN